MPTVYIRGNRDVLLQFLRQLPAIVSGSQPDPSGLGREVRTEVGRAALQATAEESARPYPTNRPRGPRPPIRIPRGLLTAAQDKKWRTIYATRRNWLQAKFGMGEEEASRVAAKIAWSELISDGARTRKAEREAERQAAEALRVQTRPGQVELEGSRRDVPQAEDVPDRWWGKVLQGTAEGIARAVDGFLSRALR